MNDNDAKRTMSERDLQVGAAGFSLALVWVEVERCLSRSNGNRLSSSAKGRGVAWRWSLRIAALLSEDDEKKISALLTRVELGGKVTRGKTIRQLCGVTGMLSASHEHFRNERRVASSWLTTII
jgi:hypothetical protein